MGKNNSTEEKREVAARLRQIRKSMGMTQEEFAEILEISEGGYKKLERAENHISIEGVRKLERELRVSSDYLLFEKREDVDEIWKMILNCSEEDKMCLLMRLMTYFIKTKEACFDRENGRMISG